MGAFVFIQTSFPVYYTPRFEAMVLSRDKAEYSDVSSLCAMPVLLIY